MGRPSHPETILLPAIDSRYGTWRGLIRLQLAEIEWIAGRLRAYGPDTLARAQRLVFVCLGNICRSPFAEAVATRHGLPTVSIGLSTSTGGPAHPTACEVARARGYALEEHRSLDLADFAPEPGDLMLTMEVRHAHRVRAWQLARGDETMVALLGQWARPRRVHIHDPLTLSRAYFETCYRVIESAVDGLASQYRQTTER